MHARRSWHITDALAGVIVAGEWSGISRAAIGAPILAAALDASLIALLLYVVASWWRRGRPSPGAAMLPTALVAGYFTYALVEMLNPNVPGLIVGLEGFRKTAFTMTAFLVVLAAPTARPERFFRIIAIGSLAALLWSIRQFLYPLPIEQAIIDTSGVSPITFHANQVMRAFSPTSGPFHLGIISAGVTIIALALSQRSSWWLGIATIGAIALSLSLTRGNMVGAGVGTLVVLATVAASHRPRLLLGSIGIALVVVVTSLSASGIGPFVPSPPGETPQLQPSAAVSQTPGTPPSANAQPTPAAEPAPRGNLFDDRNLRLRFGYWAVFGRAVLERPLFGYGTSSAADGMSSDYAGSTSVRFEPHSMYFKAALELGLPGLLAFLGILAWSARAWVKRLATDRLVSSIGLGLLATTAVSGLTGPMLDAYPYNVLFWATLGWVARSVAPAGFAGDGGTDRVEVR